MSIRADRADHWELCFVCGLNLPAVGEDAPWGISGKDPTFAFCPCCGVEFGYQDATLDAARNRREAWAQDSYRWADPERQPADWQAAQQLSNLPDRAR